MAEIACGFLASNAVNLALREVYSILYIQLILIANADDFCTGINQATASCLALDDIGVVLDVDRGEDTVHQRCQVSISADVIKLSTVIKLGCDGDQVRWLATVVEIENSLVDLTVCIGVEVFGPEVGCNFDNGITVEQHAAQHGLLCFVIMGW